MSGRQKDVGYHFKCRSKPESQPFVLRDPLFVIVCIILIMFLLRYFALFWCSTLVRCMITDWSTETWDVIVVGAGPAGIIGMYGWASADRALISKSIISNGGSRS